MKCHIVVHRHLSSVQKAIQAAHVVSQLDYHNPIVEEWARDSKTIILREARNSAHLLELECQLGYYTVYPWVSFQEDEETLGGIVTAIAVIVPEYYSIDLDNYRLAA